MATPRQVLYSRTNCNIPKNRPDYSGGMIGATSVECSNYSSSITESGDQSTYDSLYEDYINSKGLIMKYYPYLYRIDQSEKIHGEHSAADYGAPFDIAMVIEVKDAPSWVSAAGFDNDETVTGWIHIKTFRKKVDTILANNEEQYSNYCNVYERPYYVSELGYGSQMRYDDITKAIEPKPKDLFQLTVYGCDREWDRGNRIFEITNVEDEIFSEAFNLAYGHYIWKITAKRYRYSHEEGLSQAFKSGKDNMYIGNMGEHGNHQVHDNKSIIQMFYDDNAALEVKTAVCGVLDVDNDDTIDMSGYNESSGYGGAVEFVKVYNQDIVEESKSNFDMSETNAIAYTNDMDEELKEITEEDTSSSSVIYNGYI